MKKLLPLIALPMLFAANANAAFVGAQAAGGAPHTTIAQFKSETDVGESSGLFDMVLTGAKADEKEYVLKGHIQNQIDSDSYTIADDTGSIIADINVNLFNGVDITAQDTVMFYGEADYEDLGLTFDVDRLEVIKGS